MVKRWWGQNKRFKMKYDLIKYICIQNINNRTKPNILEDITIKLVI